MAVALYYAWDRLGRPLEPCQPIRDTVNRLKLAFPRAAAANLFSWHANEEHYQAEPPQDHTPFSATGWPLDSPQWVVFATDVMHRPDLGVDCNVLFAYWLAEAKAGRMPWLKYMIWQAKRYDVRNQWRPVASSGHFDHIHKSTRTDHRYTTLGSWSLVPDGDDEMTPAQAQTLDRIDGRVTAMLYDMPTNPAFLNERNQLHERLVRMEAKLDAALAAIAAIGTDSPEVAQILAALEEQQAELEAAIAAAAAEARDAVADGLEGGSAAVRADA